MCGCADVLMRPFGRVDICKYLIIYVYVLIYIYYVYIYIYIYIYIYVGNACL